MTTKLEKVARQLNDEFRDVLKKEMKKRYKIDIETHYNFMSGEIVSTRVDDLDFLPEQMEFMKAFGDGFAEALTIVREEARRCEHG